MWRKPERYGPGGLIGYRSFEEEDGMSHDDHFSDRNPQPASSVGWRAGLVLAGFLAITGALLLTEHRAHVLGLLIWLPLLACPLMHFFMHGRHGGGHGNHLKPREDKQP